MHVFSLDPTRRRKLLMLTCLLAAGERREFECAQPQKPPKPPPLAPEEAAAQRVSLVNRYHTWMKSKMWKTLPVCSKLWAVSDLHVDFPDNWRWLQEMPACKDDGIIVAGDVGTALKVLRETFSLLKSKFKHVFYCPGNHELWLSPSDIHEVPDSIEKFFKVRNAAARCRGTWTLVAACSYGDECTSATAGARGCR